MKTQSLKKWSLLGLVLASASVVTAAMLPNNSKVTKVHNGLYVNQDSADGDEVSPVPNPTCTGQGSQCDVTQTGTVQSDESNTLTTTPL